MLALELAAGGSPKADRREQQEFYGGVQHFCRTVVSAKRVLCPELISSQQRRQHDRVVASRGLFKRDIPGRRYCRSKEWTPETDLQVLNYDLTYNPSRALESRVSMY
jgi:hypothetical protein